MDPWIDRQTDKQISYKLLIHTIMETDSPNGIDSSPSLKAREPGALRAEGDQYLKSAARKRENLIFLYLFILFRPSTDWSKPSHVEEGNMLDSATIQILIFSRNALTETPRNNV